MSRESSDVREVKTETCLKRHSILQNGDCVCERVQLKWISRSSSDRRGVADLKCEGHFMLYSKLRMTE